MQHYLNFYCLVIHFYQSDYSILGKKAKKKKKEMSSLKIIIPFTRMYLLHSLLLGVTRTVPTEHIILNKEKMKG